MQYTVEKIKTIREHMKVAQSRQKSYADNRRRDLEFQVGDKVFLRVSPWKGVFHFGKKGKLSSRYIGPYEILGRVGPVAYRVALPPDLAQIHNVFHMSVLRKYISDPSHVIHYEPVQLQQNLSYEEQLVKVLARRDKVQRTKVIPLVKVLWRNHAVEEASWEREDEIRSKYPELFRGIGPIEPVAAELPEPKSKVIEPTSEKFLARIRVKRDGGHRTAGELG
ncbi:uncharacterized protein [Typha latifolia]|uniref:uncharacterized protein n=1 Tax=Typha latifolia TaxID=4733 RepID=UPI003C2DA877